MINRIKRLGLATFFEIKSIKRMNPNIIIFVVYGMLFDMGTNIYKPFAAKFLTRIGGNATHISLYNALPWLLAALVLIPGSFLMSRAKSSKKITCALIFISRMLLFLAVFIPALPLRYMPFAFIAVMSLLNVPEALSQASLQSVIGTVLEGNQRPLAIGLRNKFGQLCILISSITTGIIISYVPKTEAQTLFWYQIFFGIVFFIGLWEVYTFSRFKLPKRADNAEIPERKFSDVLKTFKNKKFMKYALTVMCFYLPWMGCAPIFSLLQIEKLGANEFWIAVSAAATGMSAILSASFWTKFINKNGNHKALTIATCLMGTSIFLYMAAPNIVILCIMSLYSGFCVMGTTTTILNGLLEATPDEDRMTYIGVYSTLINLAQFAGPLLVLLLYNSFGLMWALGIVSTLRIVAGGLIYFVGKPTKI